MTDVKIVEIKHIKDIPDELLDKAIDSGEIREGKTVTLLVELADNPHNSILIDLFLKEDGQENLIRINNTTPIEEKAIFLFCLKIGGNMLIISSLTDILTDSLHIYE